MVGERAGLVWDTLGRPRDIQGVEDLIGGLPFTVVYSHGDWDHVWGTSGLSVDPQGVLAHEGCLDRFQREIPQTLAERREGAPGLYDDVVLVPPTGTVREGQKLGLGGISVEFHSLPGHTPDSIVGFCPESGVLLAGDAVEAPLPFLNPGSPLDVWARHLDRWRQRLEGWRLGSSDDSGLRPEAALEHERRESGPLVIPAHGPPGGPELLGANAAYLRALQAGAEPEVPGELSPFYRETHENNRALALGG